MQAYRIWRLQFENWVTVHHSRPAVMLVLRFGSENVGKYYIHKYDFAIESKESQNTNTNWKTLLCHRKMLRK